MEENYTRGSAPLEEILTKLRARKANSLIKNTKERILDIGCGSYPYFLTTTNFKEKYGIDPSLRSEKAADDIFLKKQRVDNKKLPFKDNFFDAVTMLAVFEHIEDTKLIDILGEVRRVLKPNGIFIITTPAPWLDKPLHMMAKIGLISKEEIHDHKHNLSKEKIVSILQRAQFNKEKIKSGYFEIYMNMWFTAFK